MIDYCLGHDSSGPVTLEIKDEKGNVVRRYASTDAAPQIDLKQLKIPRYWIRPPQPLSAAPGLHRFLWDMHYTPLPSVEPEFPMTAVFRNTAPEATSPWVPPGGYSVVLTANGKSYTQPFTLKMDPRVKASAADLTEQFDLSKKLYDARHVLGPIGKSFDELNTAVVAAKERAGQNPVAQQLDAFARSLGEFATPNGRPGSPPTFDALVKVQGLYGTLQDVDAAPRPSVKGAIADVLRESGPIAQRWQEFVSQDLTALNRQLDAAGVGKIELAEAR